MPSFQISSPDLSVENFWSAWYNGTEPNDNLSLINAEAVDGHCYIRLLCYFAEFGLCDPMVLCNYIGKLKSRLGAEPNGLEALTEVCIGYYTVTTHPKEKLHETIGELDDGEQQTIERLFLPTYDAMKTSIVRLKLESVNGVLHFSGNPDISCDCSGPVCEHGWTFRASTVLMVTKGRIVGASGFDMNAFLNGGLDDEEEDEDFDDVYSSFNAPDPGKPKISDWAVDVEVPTELTVKNKQPPSRQPVQTYLKSEGFAPQPNDGRLKANNRRIAQETLVAKVNKEASNSAELSDLRDQIKELSNVVARSVLSVADTVEPNDSSSMVERYSSGKRFMQSGTVLSPEAVRTTHAATAGMTALTVQDDLVSGFTQNEVTRVKEHQFVSKLKPINGLPRPFVNNRLNFLINLTSGLTRSKKRYPDDLLRCLFHSMSVDSVVPVDNLLKQVLNVTIDKHDGVIASNPFRLPYVELGMHVNENCIVAMIDLLNSEFQQLWFQEFKGLRIPDFWNTYDNLSQDPLHVPTRRKTEQRTRERRSPPQKESRTRSIFGM